MQCQEFICKVVKQKGQTVKSTLYSVAVLMKIMKTKIDQVFGCDCVLMFIYKSMILNRPSNLRFLIQVQLVYKEITYSQIVEVNYEALEREDSGGMIVNTYCEQLILKLQKIMREVHEVHEDIKNVEACMHVKFKDKVG